MIFSYPQRKPIDRNKPMTVVPGYTGPKLVNLKSASERVVKRTPNSYELSSNFEHRLMFDGRVSQDDRTEIMLWAETVEAKSAEVYPFGRINTMRLHTAHRGLKSGPWCICFRHRDDMMTAIAKFPVLRMLFDEAEAKLARKSVYARINDVDSRLVDAREDEANDDRLAALKGTDKQVAWAGDIRREYIERGRCDPTMLSERSASVWIDKRNEI